MLWSTLRTVHLLASYESNLWGVLTRRKRSGDGAVATADSPTIGPARDIQGTIMRALHASLVLGVGGGVLLVAIGATLMGVILLAMGILAAVGIYGRHRSASLS
jgi:hypothetical protein